MRVNRFAVLAAAASCGWPCAAAAQEAPPVISPINIETDHNGVNLATGRMTVDGPVLSVPGAPNLRFDRVQNAAPYVTGTISGTLVTTSNFNIHTGAGPSESFHCEQALCEAGRDTGSVFLLDSNPDPNVPNVREYRQAGSGVRYYFDVRFYSTPGPPRQIQDYASRVVWPNGETITYSYDLGGLTGDPRLYRRPNRIASNLGYHIQLTYPVQYMEEGIAAWLTPQTATLYRTGAQGLPDVPLRRFTYNGNTVTDSGSTVADTTDDRTYICSSCGGTLGENVEALTGTLQLPGENSPAVQVTPGSSPYPPLVRTVTRDGVPWTYTYANPQQPAGTTTWIYTSVAVTGPNDFNQVYHIQSMGSPPYSWFNVVSGVTNSLGRTTSYDLDEVSLRPMRVTYPELNAVSVVYDDAGNVTSRTTHAKPVAGEPPATITESAHYTLPANPEFCDTACWRANWTRDGLQRQTDYDYNAAGQLTEQRDPPDNNGIRRRTSILYTVSPAGISRRSEVRICADTGTSCGTNAPIRTQYEYLGDTYLVTRERRVDSATGQIHDTTSDYDSSGRLLWTDGPLPGTDDRVYNRYDLFGRRTWEIGALAPNGLRSARQHSYRNSDDKLTATQTGYIPADPQSVALTAHSRTDYYYDSRRNLYREVGSWPGVQLNLIDREYDGRGRLLCEARRMHPGMFGEEPGGCFQSSWGQDRITRNTYDAAGQVLQVEQAVGTGAQQVVVAYSYTNNGKRRSVTDGNGNRAEMTYDRFDRQRRWIFPHAGAGAPNQCGSAGAANPCDYEEYGYDLAGNRTSLRKRDGSVLNYTYDNLNRLILKAVPERAGLDPVHTRDVHYGYDLRDAQLFARFDSPTGEGVTNVYDGFGRQTASTLLMNGVSQTLGRAHDDANNRITLQHPSGYAFTYANDALGRLTSLSGGFGPPATLATFSYNSQGLPATRTDGSGSSVAWSYDPIGRPTSLSDSFTGGTGNVALSFEYNQASQILSLTRSNDAYAWTSHHAVQRPYAVNGLNQYTSAGPAAFTYDANGNLTSDGASTFTYDVENRLVARSGGVSLRYDPLGRLYEVATASGWTRFLYDGDALVAEYLPSGLYAVYAHGSDAGADDPLAWYGPGFVRWLHGGQQGSIVGLADQQGNLAAINRYDEYGIPATDQQGNNINTGRFQYTGQIWLAELGLYHYKARVYSPTLGRFLQTDPIGYDDQVNLYAYVGNDPVNAVDPTGMTCDPAGRQASGAPAMVCRMDRVATVERRGREYFITARRPVDASDGTKFDGYNQNLTAAANQLLQEEFDHPGRETTVEPFGPCECEGSFRTNAGRLAESLRTRVMTYAPDGPPGEAMATRGTDAQGNAETIVYRRGLTANRAGLVHDGAMHGSIDEASGHLQGRLGRPEYNQSHNPKYQTAACAALGGHHCSAN